MRQQPGWKCASRSSIRTRKCVRRNARPTIPGSKIRTDTIMQMGPAIS